MESTGQPGRVQTTQAVHELLAAHHAQENIGTELRGTIEVKGKALQVEILDTAGQHEYTPLRETFMHTGNGFLLVYSITDDQTLEDLRDIREQIRRVHPDENVCVCVYEEGCLFLNIYASICVLFICAV